MLENKMWEQVKKVFWDCFLYRIENRTGKVPDIYFSIKDSNGWIELKNIVMVKKNGIIDIPFRPGQYPWIIDHLRYNKNIFLIGTIQFAPEYKWFVKMGTDIKESYSTLNLKMLTIKQVRAWVLSLLYNNKLKSLK